MKMDVSSRSCVFVSSLVCTHNTFFSFSILSIGSFRVNYQSKWSSICAVVKQVSSKGPSLRRRSNKVVNTNIQKQPTSNLHLPCQTDVQQAGQGRKTTTSSNMNLYPRKPVCSFPGRNSAIQTAAAAGRICEHLMRSPVAPSTASKLEEARSRQIKIALTHHRDGTAAIKDGFIVMSISAGKRDQKKQGNGREERIPWPVAVGRCWFSRLFDSLQPHWADMAEKAGLSCSRWL